MKSPVQGQRLATIEELFHSPAGSFAFHDDRMNFICPCGCGTFAGITVVNGPPDVGHWGFDGHFDSPTVEPSIRIMTGCKFHGFLHDGIWSFAEDSGI